MSRSNMVSRGSGSHSRRVRQAYWLTRCSTRTPIGGPAAGPVGCRALSRTDLHEGSLNAESMATLSYRQLRARHVVFSLKALSRRQQDAVLTMALLIGPAVLGALNLIASAFAIIVQPGSSLALRIVLYAGWLLVSTLVVLALREPIFMLRARDFVRGLPIKRHTHFASDLSAIAVAYSFLWTPIAYFIWET